MDFNFDTGLSAINNLAQQQMQNRPQPQQQQPFNFGVSDFFQDMGLPKGGANALASGIGWSLGLGGLGALMGGGQDALQGLGMGLLGGAAGDYLRANRAPDDSAIASGLLNLDSESLSKYIKELQETSKKTIPAPAARAQPDFSMLPRHQPIGGGMPYREIPLSGRPKI